MIEKSKKLLLLIITLFLFSCMTNKETEIPKEEVQVEDEKPKSLVNIPEGGHEVIDQILNEPMEEIIIGSTGFTENQGLKIWYNTMNPGEGKETVLLLQGSGTPAIHGTPVWLVEELLKLDYNVIQFDYRETGLSDMQTNWRMNNAYTFKDLGSDAIAVMNENSIDKCHIIGISMGGMVAQSMSIHFPERIKSVTSMISTGYMLDPTISQEKINNMGKFGDELKEKYWGGYEDRGYLEINLAYINYYKGAEDKVISKEEMYEILRGIYYNKIKRAPYNSLGSDHHNMAVYFSGSRLDALRDVKLPYLAIHGLSDNFVDIKHAKKYSSLLENCETLWVEGMGHSVLLRQDSKIILNSLLPFLKRNS